MKKSPTGGNRGKQPFNRIPYLGTKPSRSYLNVERPGYHPTSPPLGIDRLMSIMSECPEIQEMNDGIPQFPSKEVNDCMSNWMNFLKLLKALCLAGSELTDSIIALNNGSLTNKDRANYLKAMWEHIIHSTNSATAIAKNQTIKSLQEVHIAPDIDSDQSETNQLVVCSGLVRLASLQYQWCGSVAEWLVTGASWCDCSPSCPSLEAESIARCFAAPRQPPPAPQRRWSEAAAVIAGTPAEVRNNTDSASSLRRWSVPWKLALPTSQVAQDKSRSTTPDTGWHSALASQEELQEVISLLSCNPGQATNTSAPPLPGVVLTRAAEVHHETVSRNHTPRGSWWSDAGDEIDSASLGFRKSSSSTDSSSCYSIHSRSTSGSEELTHGQRSHLYSMWSGTDLPFIKLSDTTENNDT